MKVLNLFHEHYEFDDDFTKSDCLSSPSLSWVIFKRFGLYLIEFGKSKGLEMGKEIKEGKKEK